MTSTCPSHGCIRNGFGPPPADEDPFDAVVGLVGVPGCLEADRCAPTDAPLRRRGGLRLGSPVEAGSSASRSPERNVRGG